jgi:hypothetical protein
MQRLPRAASSIDGNPAAEAVFAGLRAAELHGCDCALGTSTVPPAQTVEYYYQ